EVTKNEASIHVAFDQDTRTASVGAKVSSGRNCQDPGPRDPASASADDLAPDRGSRRPLHVFLPALIRCEVDRLHQSTPPERRPEIEAHRHARTCCWQCCKDKPRPRALAFAEDPGAHVLAPDRAMLDDLALRIENPA